MSNAGNKPPKSGSRVVTRMGVTKLSDLATPRQIARVERRLFLKRGLSLGALGLLTGCDISDNEAVSKVLWAMSHWNDGVQKLPLVVIQKFLMKVSPRKSPPL